MLPQELQKLAADFPYLMALSLVLVCLGIAIHQDRVRFFRFVRPLEPREPPLWGWAEILLCLSFWCLMQVMFGGMSAALFPKSLAAATFFAHVNSTIFTCALAVHLIHGRLGQPIASLGLGGTSLRNVPPTLLFCAVNVLPIQAVAVAWVLLLGLVFGFKPESQALVVLFEESAERQDVFSMALLVLSGVLVAPVGEEILLRGMVFGQASARWGPTAGALVSSVLFSLCHFSVMAFFPLILVGCILCYVYRRTGSLYPSMLYHAAFNGLAFAQIFLKEPS